MNALRLSKRMRHAALLCFVYFICFGNSWGSAGDSRFDLSRSVLYKPAWNLPFKVHIFRKLLENSLLWLWCYQQVLFVHLHSQSGLTWFLTSFFRHLSSRKHLNRWEPNHCRRDISQLFRIQIFRKSQNLFENSSIN